MKKTVEPNSLQVCLLSSHPFALSELERVLKSHAFILISRLLESDLESELRRLSIPRANVYVVDPHAMRPGVGTLTSHIFSQNPKARIIVVSDKFDSAESNSFLQMGARGLLTFDEVREQLASALPLVSQGGFWVPRKVLSGYLNSWLRRSLNLYLKIESSSNRALTRRQQDVLDALIQQLSNKEIGIKLNISTRTVKFHISNILGKYGVRRRSDLILLCSQTSSPTPDPLSPRVAKRNDPRTHSGILARS